MIILIEKILIGIISLMIVGLIFVVSRDLIKAAFKRIKRLF